MGNSQIKHMRVGVFTSYSGDAAIYRRLAQLRAADCEVTLFAFERQNIHFNQSADVKTIKLGKSVDRHYALRSMKLILALIKIFKSRRELRACDRFYVRNLDMALLCYISMTMTRHKRSFSYEVLDIREMLVSRSIIGSLARLLERQILKRCAEVIVSSATFIHRYFHAVQNYGGPWVLVENKYTPGNVLKVNRPNLGNRLVKVQPQCWSLGWFGTLRSEHDLHVLTEVSKMLNGLLHVEIYGTLNAISESRFRKIVETSEHVTYHGVYNIGDLPSMYGRVHFMWCGDNSHDDFNESILIPNRLFEAGYFAAPLIACDGTATGDYVKRLSLGWCLEKITVSTVSTFFRTLDTQKYNAIVEGMLKKPVGTFCDDGQVTRLVRQWENAMTSPDIS